MASQTITAPKRATKPTPKATRGAAKKSPVAMNGDKRTSCAGRIKPTSEMTLDELSLRAYKMTYKRLHGRKKKKK